MQINSCLSDFTWGTNSYSPPELRVKENNLMSLHIDKGLIQATCLPTKGKDDQPTNHKDVSILFKAEFSNLAGTGQIRLASTDTGDKTGIRVRSGR